MIRVSPVPDVFDSDMIQLVDSLSASREREGTLDFSPCDSYFSCSEIQAMRRRLKKEKGSIGINNDHVRKIESDGLDRGLQLWFNSMWHNSYLPRSYRTSAINPLLKGGDDRNATDPSDYRGISHSDTLGRGFESLIYDRLIKVLHPEIKKYQAGGMPGRGTISQLLDLVSHVDYYRNLTRVNRRGNVKPFNYVVLVLLDCSRAFDVFNRTILLSKLIRLGVRGKLLEMVAAFFERRWQHVILDG